MTGSIAPNTPVGFSHAGTICQAAAHVGAGSTLEDGWTLCVDRRGEDQGPVPDGQALWGDGTVTWHRL